VTDFGQVPVDRWASFGECESTDRDGEIGGEVLIRWQAYAGLFLAIVFWGASFVATKVVRRDLTPSTITVMRFGIGLILILIIVIWRGEFRPVPRQSLPMLALLGFLGVTFHQWLQVNGLKTAQATIGAWIVATIPIFVALLGRFFLKERLTALQTVGIIVAALGALVVVSEGDLGSVLSGKIGTVGDFLFLISSLNWAVFTVFSRRILRPSSEHAAVGGITQKDERSPLVSMLLVMGFGWIFSLIWFGAEGSVSELSALRGDSLGALAFLGLASSGLAYIFWYEGLGVVEASQAGSFLYIEPIVTALIAWPMLGERMNLTAALGGVGVLIGVWFVNRRRARPGS
jgi:drug/metabolite transporter (DMT)-like permease